ncbi:MAG: hypothetical protein SPiBPW_30480 [Shewanella algae]
MILDFIVKKQRNKITKNRTRSIKPTMKNLGFLGLEHLNQETNRDSFKRKLIIKCRNPIFKTYLFSNPAHYSKFIRRDINSFRFNNNWQEIEVWTTQIIHYKSKVNSFLKLKEKTERNILLGLFDEALSNLKDIQKLFGHSYWLVQTKLSLLSFIGKDNEALNTYKELFENCNRPVEERDLDIILSNSSNDRTSERNDYSFEAILEGLDTYEAKALEFMFRFDPLNFDEQDFKYVFQYLFPTNVIDKYLALCRMAMICRAKGDIKSEIVKGFLTLENHINDYKLANISRLQSDEIILQEEDKAIIDICDTYMTGDFNSVAKKCETYLNKWPNISNAYEFYVNSLIATDGPSCFIETSLIHHIINLIRNYIVGRGDVSFSTLNKVFQQFNHFDIMPLVKLIELKSNICHDANAVKTLYSFLDINGSTFNPFRNDVSTEKSISYTIAKGTNDNIYSLDIPEYRKLKWHADKLFNENNYPEALILYKRIKNCPLHLEDEIRAKIALSMIKSGECQNTVEYISNSFFKNSKNVWKLPKELLFKEINDSENINLESIDTVITIYLLLKHDYTEHQVISLYLNDYLTQFGINSPSKLRPKCHKQRFLLKNICDLSILEGLNIYRSNNEMILERVNILSNLISEKGEEEKVKEELDFMIHQYTKNSCIKKLGKGKLHVDQSKVFAESKKLLANVFNELVLELDKEELSPQIEKSVSVTQKDQKIVITDRKAFNLALFIMLEIRDIYTLNPMFGLDNSLNVDIRHNGIVPRLRSVFEKHDLLCKQVNGEYLDNDFIEDCFKSSLTQDYYKRLQDAFKTFSKSINNFLIRIKNNYMQIGTDDLSSIDSLFKFSFESDEVNNMISLIKSDSNFDEIIKWNINSLDRKAEGLIKTGKEIITNVLSERVDVFFKELKAVSNELKNNSYRVNEKISLAKTDFTSASHEVSCWLDFVKSSGEHFNINIPILEALNFVQNLFPKVNVSLQHAAITSATYDGKHLKSFIRVFIMLFENSVSRRKFDKKCELVIRWNEKDNTSKLVVSSLSKKIDLEKIEEINKTVNNINYLDKASRDKNSGFFKIKKIFEQDLNAKNQIELFADGESFKVKIEFSNRNTLKMEPD